MALVRAIIADALVELGVIAPGGSVSASIEATGLNRIQSMIDAWAANRLTLSLQLRTVFTMPSGTSSIQVGPGGAVNIGRPMWLNTVNYIIPGSSPEVEVPIGQMDEDAYAALSIKELQSALPIQSFYQTNLSDVFGTLFLWPQVTQNVEIVIYSPQAVTVPTTLATDLIGPPGYRDAFMYGLAERLITPLGVKAEDVPMLAEHAARAWTTMTRPNIMPGVLIVDAALVPHSGAGYNILSDITQSSR
jgi:hypothetical protein